MEYMNGSSALQIYMRKQDHRNYNSDSVRSYFMELRAEIYYELTNYGSCPLIEYLFFNDPTGRNALFDIVGAQNRRYPVILLLAVDQAIEAALDAAPLAPVRVDTVDLGRGVTCPWSKFTAHSHDRIPDPHSYYWNLSPAEIRSIQEHYLQIQRRFQDDPNPPSRDHTRERPDPAEQIHAQAQSEADQIRGQAQEDASEIRDAAKHDADEIVREAEAKARQIQRQAEETVANEVQQEVERRIQQELRDYIHQQRAAWEAEQADTARERADTSRLTAELKEDACTRTTALGAEMNRSLTDLQARLDELRAGVLSDLQGWRSSLYKCEYGPLVNVYSMLCSLTNRIERDALSAQTAAATPEEMQTQLTNHSTSMGRLRNSLIRAMESMGLRQFSPQPGDRFDSYYHTTNDVDDCGDDDQYHGNIIDRCLSPGIERVVNSQESLVLLRATVALLPKDGDPGPNDTFYGPDSGR